MRVVHEPRVVARVIKPDRRADRGDGHAPRVGGVGLGHVYCRRARAACGRDDDRRYCLRPRVSVSTPAARSPQIALPRSAPRPKQAPQGLLPLIPRPKEPRETRRRPWIWLGVADEHLGAVVEIKKIRELGREVREDVSVGRGNPYVRWQSREWVVGHWDRRWRGRGHGHGHGYWGCKGRSAGRAAGLVDARSSLRWEIGGTVKAGEAGAHRIGCCAGWLGAEERGRRDNWVGGDGRGLEVRLGHLCLGGGWWHGPGRRSGARCGDGHLHGWRALDGGCCCERRLHRRCGGLVSHRNIGVGHSEDRLLNAIGLYDCHLYGCIVRRKRRLHLWVCNTG
jgi:hypothetical protein